MSKKVATALPLYNCVAFGHDSYINRVGLIDLMPHAKRWWRTNSQIVSLELQGGGIVKSLEGFPEHANSETAFMDLMESCYSRGVTRPSSYSDIFYQSFRSPCLQWSKNSLFYNHFAGGWEQARTTGVLRGEYKKYDINSAYFWALSQGLPDVRTLRFSRAPSGYSDVAGFPRQGLYVVSLDTATTNWNLPYPFNTPRRYYIATTLEIERYGLAVKEYHSGVTWEQVIDTSPIVDLLLSLPASKHIARSFWGRWASRARVECHMASGKTWSMRNPVLNIVWAHAVVSAVKMHIWEHAATAAHVFVDSIITRDDLPTGTKPGEWRLEATYSPGLRVLGAGIYGPISGPLDKNSGGRG